MTGLEKPTILIILLLQIYQAHTNGAVDYSCYASNSNTQPTYYVVYGSYAQPQTYSQAECYNSYSQQQQSYYCPYTVPPTCDQYMQGYDVYASPPCAQTAYEIPYCITYNPRGVFDSMPLPIPDNVPYAHPYGPSSIIIINGEDDDNDWNEFFALLVALQGTNNPPEPNQNSSSGKCGCSNNCGKSKCCSKSNSSYSKTNCGCSKTKCGNSNSGCGKGKSKTGIESPCNDCDTCTHITIIIPKCCED